MPDMRERYREAIEQSVRNAHVAWAETLAQTPVEIRAAEADDGPIGFEPGFRITREIMEDALTYTTFMVPAGTMFEAVWAEVDSTLEAAEGDEWARAAALALQQADQHDLTGMSLAEVNALLDEVLEPEEGQDGERVCGGTGRVAGDRTDAPDHAAPREP